MKIIGSIWRIWVTTAVLITLYSCNVSFQYWPHSWQALLNSQFQQTTVQQSIQVLLLLAWYGLIAAVINIVRANLYEHYKEQSILRLARALKAATFIALCNKAFKLFDMPYMLQIPIQQALRVVSLSILGYFFFRFIQNSDSLFLVLKPNIEDKLDARRRHTYVTMVKRIVLLFWSILIIAAILMTFQRIRSLGTAILASAGVVSTIVLFSARHLLENVFRGIQLAIFQPIRMEDTITINGETGNVSAINLQHVAVTLSDRSQLIVPTSDLLDRTFKNWTHTSNHLIGNVVLYTNYTMPIEPIEQKFNELLQKNKYWDKHIAELEINNFNSFTIELKLLMSAKSGRHLSKLRNEIKKDILKYMQKHHATGLPSAP